MRFSLLSCCSELPTRSKIENIGNWAEKLCCICGNDNSRLPPDLGKVEAFNLKIEPTYLLTYLLTNSTYFSKSLFK